MSRKKKGPAEPAATKPAPSGPLHQKPFEALKSLRDKLAPEDGPDGKPVESASAKARVPPRKTGSAAIAGDVWRPDLDRELFDVAMSGVVPLRDGKASGRVAPGQTPVKESAAKLRRAAAEGDGAIDVRWMPDGTCEAARRGRSFALEALERFAIPQDRLDLHRLDPSVARARVEEFVRTRRARGLRTVSIIHGVGRHSPDGTSVLRDEAVRALSQPPGSREVDAFRTAGKDHGGAGALVVALRDPAPARK